MIDDLTARVREVLEEEAAMIGPADRAVIVFRITEAVVKKLKERDDRLVARIREALG